MKILSIGFHQGAINALDSVVKTDKHCVAIDKYKYHYNVTRDKAEALWNTYKDFYNEYDCIITSDTAALARIFLQNNYKGKLIIWICNRFDYWDESDGTKPDKEFYELFKTVNYRDNVRVIAYSKYDQVYASRHGIFVEDVVVPARKPSLPDFAGLTYYIPDYQNNYTFNLAGHCRVNGLFVKEGRHSGLNELKTFKAVVHLPYHWQGVAEMDALSVGVPYYVPTKRLLFELIETGNYWFQNVGDCKNWIDICSFYDKHNKDFMFYFDSFKDIRGIAVDVDSIHTRAWKIYGDVKDKWNKLIYGT